MQRRQRTRQQCQAGPRAGSRRLQPGQHAADHGIVFHAGSQRHGEDFHRRELQPGGDAQQAGVLSRGQGQRLGHLLGPALRAGTLPGLAQKTRLGRIVLGLSLQQRAQGREGQFAAAEHGAVHARGRCIHRT